MDLAVRSYKTLVVTSSEKFNETVLPLLSAASCAVTKTVSSGMEARREALENSFDIILINTSLPDEFGTKLALDLAGDSGVGIMLFTSSEHFMEINSRVSRYGILVISKPTSSAIVAQSLSLLCATRERLRRMEQKTASIEEKMEEIRLVNRAKWVLIDKLDLSEPEAHRYIEKMAMDRSETKREVADFIIKNIQ